MGGGSLDVPVAFFIFNRLDTTERVFAAIRQAQPRVLLVVADGPRPTHADEAQRCAATRALVEQVDWDCQVLRNYAEANLGCRRRIASGLDWVFEQVEAAIILEDDCLPHPTFFAFCAELLARYHDDERIMAVSGDNHQFGFRPTRDSYYFSRYNHIWGWATWRRAWRHYDVEMNLWPRVRDEGWLRDVLGDAHAVRYWTRTLQSTYEGRVDTWDSQWTLASWLQNGLVVIPSVNLVSNIGFGAAATHTTGTNRFAALPAEPMPFPLQHPAFVIRNALADDHVQRTSFYDPNLFVRGRAWLRVLPSRLRGVIRHWIKS
jgi:hypothetical protein